MELFRDQYNLDKVAKLPDVEIEIGTFTVTQQNETLDYPTYEYLFILDDFTIALQDLFSSSSNQTKDYTFMLIIPKKVIADKIDSVHRDVGNDIRDVFIIPFALVSLGMMILISWFLQKISTHITEPIIELF
jgi:hypothetical protein